MQQRYQNRLLTLLSDFGERDVYVGVMKGVIAQVNRSITAVDLTHQIPPQNIAAARFCLMNAYPYFPSGTVHVAVVDPGVGSMRRAVAVELTDGFLVGPDNGLFSGVLSQSQVVAAVELTNPDYWRTSEPSATFHGRDIFAPVGAHLASGVSLKHLGQTIEPSTLVQLAIPGCTHTRLGIIGYIQYIDRFGNLITNIPGAYVQGKTWSVSAAGLSISGGQTYSDVPPGNLVALVGSHNWVEIAVNGGNAQSQLPLDWGSRVQVELQP
ncbi:MAG: SAM-dependent chlorinase/fluorinase [Chroococcidiopsidaceae cyanobacterium CP_BM_ER_R8_30]|nr:SAM-dependent chlorinase/fluorinase [Chroococcidiopsidaceae cyanobacterium CP_BM_ER_R8_30]